MDTRPSVLPDRTITPIAVASLLSGIAALSYQATWQRVLSQSIGADAISTAVIVAIFMAGLGLGSICVNRTLGGAVGPWIVRYAVIEIAIGTFGMVSVSIIRAANAATGTWSAGSLWTDVAVNFAVLVVPIFLMGMTSPIIVEIGKRRLEDFGRRAGLLYGLNILGAALGAAVTGLVLIEMLGLSATCTVAAGLNFLAAGLVLRTRRRSFPSTNPATLSSLSGEDKHRALTPPTRPVRLGAKFLLGCVLLGYASIGLQMLFFRILANFFTLSSIVFPIVLTAFLLLMAAGQQLGGTLGDRFERARLPVLLSVLFAASTGLLLAALSFPPSWGTALGAQVFSPSVASLLDGVTARVGDPNLVVAFAFAIVFMLSVLPQSALFPVVVKQATEHIELGGRRFAQVYAAYTLGNVLGSLFTGLVLYEWVGTYGALWAAILGGAIGVILLSENAALLSRSTLIVGVSVCVAAVTLPRDYFMGFTAGRYRPATIEEGRMGVVSVVPTERFYTLVDMYRTESASAMTRPPADGDAYEAWRWNFSDLLALDPAFRPRRILLIGLGHGYLPLTLLEYDFVEKIVIVEISSEVIGAVVRHSSPDLAGIYKDPRVELVVADGRRYLQGAIARGERFDLIQNRINEPWRAGGGSLFTVEFFELMSRALNRGGYVATRHMTGYAVNALSVFQSGVWAKGSYHMYFSMRQRPDYSSVTVSPDIRRAYLSAYPGRQQDSSSRASMDVVGLSSELFPGHPVNTDDRPRFEYYLIDDLREKLLRKQRVYLDGLALQGAKLPVVIEAATNQQ
jgi:spermidine synthase